MPQRTFAVAVFAALAIAGGSFSCSTQKQQLPSTTPPAAAATTIPGVNATPGVAPPAAAVGQPGTAAPAADIALPAYQGQVKKRISEGSIEVDAIVSAFSCASAKDCTATKYANAPADEDACTCAAPCTPYVVNQAEKQRREETNKRLCHNDDWYGPLCPAPNCGFIEFEKFKCHEGKCAGLAMGKAQ